MLQHFRLAQYRINLTARERISLPPYAGSTFRGGFGVEFKRIVCTVRDTECQECTLNSVCPYAYIFETSPPDDATQLRTYSDVPRPFIIDPLESHGTYAPGDSLEFLLTLIGRGIDYLPYFLVSFRELGDIGIGKGRGRFQLSEVHAESGVDKGEPVYSWETEVVSNVDNVLDFGTVRQQITEWSTELLTLEFLTPTRITHEGKLTDELPFHVFLQRLLGRISALSYFHCGESLTLDFKELIAQATEVETVESTLRWHDWTRYSRRQDRRMQFGGVLGSVSYAGELKPFLPFVGLGQSVHVGKHATFGLGKYRVCEYVESHGP